MPELPEVEITARRLDEALRGAVIESVLTPGLNALRTFDPPLSALEGRAIASVGRRGKLFVIATDGGPTAIVHLMSAGRLQLWDKRAGPRDRTSRVLVRFAGDDRELRLREFGTRQAAWLRLVAADAVDEDEVVAGLGMLRMPDAFTRMQAGTKASTLGNALILIGIAVYHPGWTRDRQRWQEVSRQRSKAKRRHSKRKRKRLLPGSCCWNVRHAKCVSVPAKGEAFHVETNSSLFSVRLRIPAILRATHV